MGKIKLGLGLVALAALFSVRSSQAAKPGKGQSAQKRAAIKKTEENAVKKKHRVHGISPERQLVTRLKRTPMWQHRNTQRDGIAKAPEFVSFKQGKELGLNEFLGGAHYRNHRNKVYLDLYLPSKNGTNKPGYFKHSFVANVGALGRKLKSYVEMDSKTFNMHFQQNLALLIENSVYDISLGEFYEGMRNVLLLSEVGEPLTILETLNQGMAQGLGDKYARYVPRDQTPRNDMTLMSGATAPDLVTSTRILSDNNRPIINTRLKQFDVGAATHIKRQIATLMETVDKHEIEPTTAEGIVLDLRDNPGGDDDEMFAILKLFASKTGKYFSTVDHLGKKKEYIVDKVGPFSKVPLVVLVNRRSASASEMLAGALKYDGGEHIRIVGETTYGKGIGQTGTTLATGDAVVHTKMKVNFPNRKSYHLKGVTPMVEIPEHILPEEIRDVSPFEIANNMKKLEVGFDTPGLRKKIQEQQQMYMASEQISKNAGSRVLDNIIDPSFEPFPEPEETTEHEIRFVKNDGDSDFVLDTWNFEALIRN